LYTFKEAEAETEATAVGDALRDIIQFSDKNIPPSLRNEFKTKVDMIQNSLAKTNYNLVKLQHIYHETELRHVFVKHQLNHLKRKIEAARGKLNVNLRKCGNSFFSSEYLSFKRNFSWVS
jgi:hypothetical protein